MSDAEPLPLWPDDTPAHRLARAGGPDTSRLAALDVEPRTGSQKAILLAAYRRHGGLTDQQAAEIVGFSEIQAARRCADLRNDGLIAPTGEVRIGRYGLLCRVCVAVEGGGND